MTMKNAYKVLGVAETASAADVKTTYRKLSLETHPDRNPGDQEKEARFKEVQAAYQILSDPEKRLAHDAEIHTARVAALAARQAAEKAQREREAAAAQAQAARAAAAQVKIDWEALFSKPAQASSIGSRSTPMAVQSPRSASVSRPSFSTGEKVVAGGLVAGFGLLLAAVFSGGKGGSHWDPSVQRNRDNDNGQFRSS